MGKVTGTEREQGFKAYSLSPVIPNLARSVRCLTAGLYLAFLSVD